MELDEFRADLIAHVSARAVASSNFMPAAFVEEAGRRLSDAGEADNFEISRYRGSGRHGRRVRVDAHAFDDADGSVMLMIANWEGEAEAQTFGQADTKRQFGYLRAYVEEALEGRLTDGSIDESTDGYGLAIELQNRREDITRLHFFLVSDGQLSSRVKDWPEEDLFGIPTEFHIWDVTRFHRAHESATGRDDLDVRFSDFGVGGLRCLQASRIEGKYESLLCMIPGSVLAQIYDRFGSRLLEGNVRSFLSTKPKINAQMQRTIREEPEMFFAYNNGISATAEAVTLEGTAEASELMSARNLQIVNGGQTTASLAVAHRRNDTDLSAVMVPMKLSIIPPERSALLIPSIARYANSQNKISDADFFANHPFHIRMEEFSRRLWTPAVGGVLQTHWFYERARGQYVNAQATMTRAQKTVFVTQNPRSQQLLKTDIARYDNTWRGLPHKVSLGAQKNFLVFAEWVSENWTRDDTQFNEAWFRRVVALGILFRHTEKMISGQSWYASSFRAQIATYTLARLAALIREQEGADLNFELIWDRQAVPEALERILERLAFVAHSMLTNQDTGIRNVTEWAKKEACWTRMRDTPLKLPETVLDLTVSRLDRRAAVRDASVRQRVDTGIAAQQQVLLHQGSEWQRLRQWGGARNLITPQESQMLAVAAQLPRRIPTERQSKAILEIAEKLAAEGWSWKA